VYGRAEPQGRALGEGAAQAAPTAPHATPRTRGGRRNGPERFWTRWPVRVALALCLVFSALVHGLVMPLELPHSFELNDVQGVAAIPIDVLSADDTPAPEPQPTSSPAIAPANPEGEKEEKKKEPSAPKPLAQTAPRHDAGAQDAAGDAEIDAVGDAIADAAAASDAEIAFALDAGSGPVAPRDPEAIVGAVGAVQADRIYVFLVVNAEVIRSHPVGVQMGYLLRAIPQWDDFISGTDIDPVRDIDWLMISGPSLVNTSRDVVLVHYSVPDSVVGHAIDIVSRRYDRGGRFDAGVRGVKASLAHADRAERVILRGQPHLLAVVPPDIAEKVARTLVTARVSPRIRPGEAVYLRLVDPHHPMPEVPESITELRLRVLPRADAGADVFVDCDTKDAATALEAADGVRRLIRRHDDALTSILTHGLLDHVDVTTDASLVKVHVGATLDQIETLLTLVGSLLGVQPESPAAASVAPSLPPPKARQPR
jgi:hypothetical protein